MSNIPEKYKKIHKLTFENEKLLKEVKKCACMYCNNRYDVSEIKDWIEDNYGLTAQCPYCWVDCVIPEIIDGKIVTDEELKEMEKYYFE